MKMIWKYVLLQNRVNYIGMPRGAEILTVQSQGGLIAIWVIVDPYIDYEQRVFEVYGTGETLPGQFAGRYIGTVQIGEYVWHVFDATKLY